VTTVGSSDWTPLLVIGPAFPATGTFFAAGAAGAGRFNTVFVRTQDPVADKLVKNFKLDTIVTATLETRAASAASSTTVVVAPAPAPAPAPVPKPAPIRVAVRGNQLEGYGSQSVVLVYGENDCVFAENHCAQETPANQTINTADVVLVAATVIASGNRIAGGTVALGIVAASAGACSVLGNLTLGTITVGGVALASPWAALNVQGD
jgi:hypothetical protein